MGFADHGCTENTRFGKLCLQNRYISHRFMSHGTEVLLYLFKIQSGRMGTAAADDKAVRCTDCGDCSQTGRKILGHLVDDRFGNFVALSC